MDSDFQIDYKAVFFSLAAPEDEAGLTKGNILVTSLINEAQPILKLELGDRVTVRNYSRLNKLGATIAKVDARSNDYLHLPDGEKISGATFYASLEYFPFMRQFKIVQNDVNDCTVMLRVTEKTEEKRAQVEAVLKKLLDGKIKYAVEYVDAIPVDPNGKTKILVSSVRDAKSAPLHR
jgi:phenylacetate-coenzyme A ligase PaaK-like adenylate-forming protein